MKPRHTVWIMSCCHENPEREANVMNQENGQNVTGGFGVRQKHFSPPATQYMGVHNVN